MHLRRKGGSNLNQKRWRGSNLNQRRWRGSNTNRKRWRGSNLMVRFRLIIGASLSEPHCIAHVYVHVCLHPYTVNLTKIEFMDEGLLPVKSAKKKRKEHVTLNSCCSTSRISHVYYRASCVHDPPIWLHQVGVKY